MSDLPVNDHLEGILSDFEGMRAVILNYLRLFGWHVEDKCEMQLQAVFMLHLKKGKVHPGWNINSKQCCAVKLSLFFIKHQLL